VVCGAARTGLRRARTEGVCQELVLCCAGEWVARPWACRLCPTSRCSEGWQLARELRLAGPAAQGASARGQAGGRDSGRALLDTGEPSGPGGTGLARMLAELPGGRCVVRLHVWAATDGGSRGTATHCPARGLCTMCPAGSTFKSRPALLMPALKSPRRAASVKSATWLLLAPQRPGSRDRLLLAAPPCRRPQRLRLQAAPPRGSSRRRARRRALPGCASPWPSIRSRW
jgi:hypothetical protein